tara:strand:- start:1919 stop:2239 length:321 start_codon:yes stop_codon:yes gene_type:complete
MPLKPLKPSLRENKRYLFVKGKNLKGNIERAILDFIGVLGMSKTGLHWIKTGYPNTQKGTRGHEKDFAIISVNRESVNSVRASFAVWSEKIIVEKVSGTLKGLKEK